LTAGPTDARVFGLGSMTRDGRKTIAIAGLTATALSGWLACGGGASPTAPATSVTTPTTLAPAPSPAPTATPTPAQATPAPTPTESPELNDNDAPVDHVGAGVYYVECDGDLQPNSRNAKEVKVGCRVHLDATPKDADNIPTNPRYTPEWFFSDPSAIDLSGGNPLGPMITGRVPHKQTINVWVDGVQSNSFSVTFY
jgi:hypothetical protein